MAVVSMSKQEFSRLEVLLQVQSGRLRVADACELIGLHRRQVFRLLRGAAACRHEILVGPGEGVLPRQSVGVVRDAEKQPSFFVREQRSARHDRSSLARKCLSGLWTPQV